MRFLIFLRKNLIMFVAFFFCALMIAFPEVTSIAAKKGISIWLNSVVPIIMPFFIATGFIKRAGFCDGISPKIYPFAMAVLSGYPVGAKLSGDYYREGAIGRGDLEKLLSYSMVTGPAFIMGTVGISMLGSFKMGIILCVSHYLGAILNGVIFTCKEKINKVNSREARPANLQTPLTSYYNCLTEAIIDSLKSVAIILAYIMMFMILGDLLIYTGIFEVTNNLYVEPITIGSLEMTCGINMIGICSGTEADLYKLLISSFLLSFGGFSVLGQTMSMLKGCDVNFVKILKLKLSQGAISTIISFIIYCFVIL